MKCKLDPKVRASIINFMRKRSKWYPPRNTAKNKCKVDETLYACSKCGTYCYDGKSQKNFEALVEKYPNNKVIFEKIEMDHILPVVDPIVGYQNLQEYAERLFVPEEMYRGLCPNCHGTKTKKENKVRVKSRKSKKSNKK